jgi:protein transport protein SEC31
MLFNHFNRYKKVCLSWSSDSQVQLAAACDNNAYPYVNIWDLRKPTAPLFTLNGLHKQGIEDISWSAYDPGQLLACSKDDKIACWNIRTVILFLLK